MEFVNIWRHVDGLAIFSGYISQIAEETARFLGGIQEVGFFQGASMMSIFRATVFQHSTKLHYEQTVFIPNQGYQQLKEIIEDNEFTEYI